MVLRPHQTARHPGSATPAGHARESAAARVVHLVPGTGGQPVEDGPSGVADTARLVRRAAADDQAAWTAIVEQYNGLLWSVVRGFRLGDAQAADAVQTTWLRLVENLDGIRDPERLAGWLRTTARRSCLEALQRAGRERPSELPERVADEDRTADPDRTDPEASALRQEQAATVRRAVRRLPERQQQLLELLVASPPLSYEEIGARLGMPVGSIGPTRARLLTRLRGVLAQHGLDDAAAA